MLGHGKWSCRSIACNLGQPHHSAPPGYLDVPRPPPMPFSSGIVRSSSQLYGIDEHNAGAGKLITCIVGSLTINPQCLDKSQLNQLAHSQNKQECADRFFNLSSNERPAASPVRLMSRSAHATSCRYMPGLASGGHACSLWRFTMAFARLELAGAR